MRNSRPTPIDMRATANDDDAFADPLEYATQPELAIASLMHLMSRFPATRKQAVARSIVEHLQVVGTDARLPDAVRRCADELTDEWMAYALLGEPELPSPSRRAM